MSSISLDWTAIRPLNGGREKGFEELCSQLARAEAPTSSRFVRKGTPDAGVECYAILSDETEWGWQSKYFDTIGDSQWKQIDESVITAIEKHPHLIRYYVCIPQDLPDGRIVDKKTEKKKKSARDQWDAHVKKWQGWALAKNRNVEFIWWGSSEMLDRLSRNENVGRLRFWFDKRGFDTAWFSDRLDEAIRAAGPRYTPEIHVELPIADELDGFGRTSVFFNRIKALAIPLREALRRVRYVDLSNADADADILVISLSGTIQVVLNELGAISHAAVGPLPFNDIIKKIEETRTPIQQLAAYLEKRSNEYDEHPKTAAGYDAYSRNPFRERGYCLNRLERVLEETSDSLLHAEKLTTNSTLVLRGNAGTGKTHLLCDVVKRRIEAQQPTVLLMGHRFVNSDTPWSQVMQHLDLVGQSAEEFIGALEASAQASGERALIVIDAINEGTGCTIWPTNLAAFLAQVERSSWIGVVLSVRSSYEDAVIPNEVLDNVLLVTHEGFSEYEYDATKTFFVHYRLELPSTPLLAPEFRNPLFLKTMCQGLSDEGHQRFPRGFHGISSVFNMYLNVVNNRLSKQLGYDARMPLVRRAVDAFGLSLIEANERWLQRERAAQIVDALLPNREFERSLFRGLIVEGVLAEDSLRREGSGGHDVVYVAYERLADHIVAKALLDKVPTPQDLSAALLDGGVLAGVITEEYIPAGLLEALFVQVAERFNTELLTFAPQLEENWGTSHAFRQSLIWRNNEAFSEATRKLLNKLCLNDQDFHDTLEVLLTVATVPEHPFNSIFLDQRLRVDSMADRDAWWSTYLYTAWGNHGAIDRLIDWTWTLGIDTSLEDSVVDLCGISLAWMLSTSQRFLRDCATKALVNLYTGRLPSMIRLIDRFSDIDDPYVSERIYCAAYGVAMRSHDTEAIGWLAKSVYRHVFEAGNPPPHILLRDYARGVLERALHLGSPFKFEVAHIRPPYKSTWPSIPSEEDIKGLLPNWTRGSRDRRDIEWSRNCIGASVMSGDFARYVIGTNSSSGSHSWLSIRLDEDAWIPPPNLVNQQRDLIASFSPDEMTAWKLFEDADRAYVEFFSNHVRQWLDKQDFHEALESEFETHSPPEVNESSRARDAALQALEARLSPTHVARFMEIREAKESKDRTSRPSRFDLGQAQRYILMRVFDLGWTVERFGHFDRYFVHQDGRNASKAERMGKKYQWIAYHEIMAFISDNFQYHEQYCETFDQRYLGPWQDHFRDIDPSCTLKSLPGGTSWQGHVPAWWGAAAYDSWGSGLDHRKWIEKTDDLPKIEDLLCCLKPIDGTRWLNGGGYYNWKEGAPPDQNPTDIDRREIWYIVKTYLIHTPDLGAFQQWAETVDFLDSRMPAAPHFSSMFFGEHGWSPASRHFQDECYGNSPWVQPEHECPVPLCQVAHEYSTESNGFDCSVHDSFTLQLPALELMTKLGLHWTGHDANFATLSGQLIAQDPTASSPGPSTLLILEDAFHDLQKREQVTMCWIVTGEKQVLTAGYDGPYHPRLRISGAYFLEGGAIMGSLKTMLETPPQL